MTERPETDRSETLELPALPELPDGLHQEWLNAQGALSGALGEQSPVLATELRRWLVAHCLEGLSGITPSISGPIVPPVFPRSRGFLSSRDRARRTAVRAGFDHVDVRLRLHREGFLPSLLAPETPYVLHALVEGPMPTGKVSNAGLVRITDTTFTAHHNNYDLPDPHAARRLTAALVDDVITRSQRGDDPPVALGAWTIFTFLAIHPFVDGNGRTARLLYLLLASADLGFPDLAALEVLSSERTTYIHLLRRGYNVTPRWRPEVMDATEFVLTVTGWSILGARRATRRVETASRAAAAAEAAIPGLTPEQVALIVRTWIERLLPLPVDPVRWGLAESLVERGLAEQVPLPPSRLDGTVTRGYRLTPVLTEALGAALLD